MVTPERQVAATLTVILAQCPLSYQVQSNFLKVANTFIINLINF